jgi:hypothetical protein
MQQKRLLQLLALGLGIAALSACGSGGGSSSDDGGGGGGGKTLGPQWTHQIGSATGVLNTDNVSYEPASNMLYRINTGRSSICTVAANANSSTAWDCATVTSNFPTGYTIYSLNLIPDGSGNMLAFGTDGSSQYALLKYNGSSWTSVQLNNIPSNTDLSTIYYYNGYVYGTTNSSAGGANKQYNLIAFDTSSGNYSSANSINSVYTGMYSLSSSSATIMNSNLYVAGINTVTATSLSNTSNITTYSGGTIATAIGVTSSTIFTCGPISGFYGTGINSTPLSNTTASGWTNAGWTSYINAGSYKVYEGCYSMYAGANKVFVVGYVATSTGSDAAVYTQ